MSNTNTFIGCALPPGCYPQREFSFGDMINPLLFLTNDTILCQYGNIQSCYQLPHGFDFFQSFCKDLLPFCIFYSFIKVLLCVANYIFIYKTKIERTLNKRIGDDALLDNNRPNYNYTKYFQKKLRLAFVLDIVTSIFTLCVFNGYQYYASLYNAVYTNEQCPNSDPNPNSPGQLNDFLLGPYEDSTSYKGRSVGLFFIVMIWFFLDCTRTYIQIFAVSTLTHLDNLRKERHREQPEPHKFYRRHEKFAIWWGSVLFLVGSLFIFANFFWQIFFPGDTSFQDYKLHYKYYSTNTVSFWLSYALIFILILTDRILAYDGFKKRQAFRANERRQQAGAAQPPNFIDLRNYQVMRGTHAFTSLYQTIAQKFQDCTPEEIDGLTQRVADIYSERMRNHFNDLRRRVMAGNPDAMPMKTSLAYVKFLRIYNVVNLAGYALMLFTYQQNDPDDHLPLYLTGFIVSAISTFAFDLIHNYMMYRSYFLQVRTLMERQEDEGEQE